MRSFLDGDYVFHEGIVDHPEGERGTAGDTGHTDVGANRGLAEDEEVSHTQRGGDVQEILELILGGLLPTQRKSRSRQKQTKINK